MVVRRHRSQTFAIAGLAAAMMAGCSADIRRLEKPTYALGEKPPVPQESIGRRTVGAPPSVDNSGWQNSGPVKPGVERVTALPEATQPAAPANNPSVPFDAPRKPKAAAVAAPAATTSAPIVAGNTVEVQPGDTLSGLSKRHGVSIAALMELNGLKSAALKPGQKVVLPANARRPIAKPATVPPLVPTQSTAVGVPASSAPAPIAVAPAAAPAATVQTAPAPADWDGAYTVKGGDSLFGIARAHKVNAADLQRYNGITDAGKMRQGMVLKVPSAISTPAVAAGAPAARASAESPRAAANGGVHILNGPSAGTPTQTSAATPAPVAAPTRVASVGTVPLAAAGPAKFRWPVKGSTLAGFGKRPDGAHNDGINIAVPAGTDITAAEAGTIAYAGSEIKAYGNLILVRHEGGWVTAYAHADQILVKRGDAVSRGQVIAKAGATGSVDQPQVHFELRQGSKPVDPAPHMEK